MKNFPQCTYKLNFLYLNLNFPDESPGLNCVFKKFKLRFLKRIKENIHWNIRTFQNRIKNIKIININSARTNNFLHSLQKSNKFFSHLVTIKINPFNFNERRRVTFRKRSLKINNFMILKEFKKFTYPFLELSKLPCQSAIFLPS